jgi:regulator of replication initiation timing
MHEYQQEVISLTHEKEDLIAQINEASRVKKRGSENMEVENEWLRKQISGLVAENQNMQIQVDQLRKLQ